MARVWVREHEISIKNDPDTEKSSARNLQLAFVYWQLLKKK